MILLAFSFTAEMTLNEQHDARGKQPGEARANPEDREIFAGRTSSIARTVNVSAATSSFKKAMRKYDLQDQRLLASWAADCAERVLPLFEDSYPGDDRPRRAIEACRKWVRTGDFKMTDIRAASLASHAAARAANQDLAACFAARAAGQAVATAHVPQHAFGSSYYALKAIGAVQPAHAEAGVLEEHAWQVQSAPLGLRQEVLKRVVIQKRDDQVLIRLLKDEDF
jgi:hypothetical protein